jgi:hypothetical protein
MSIMIPMFRNFYINIIILLVLLGMKSLMACSYINPLQYFALKYYSQIIKSLLCHSRMQIDSL